MSEEIRSKLLEEIDETIKEPKEDKSIIEPPLTQVHNIRKERSIPGDGEIIIGGIPVDVFSIEDMVIKVSPADMKTVLRYDNARVIEVMRNTKRPKLSTLGETNWSIFIILAIVAGLALVFLLFGEDILGFIQSIFSGI